MIELFLNNKPVALPDDASFELVRENPLFTKSGDYSLDVDIPLGFTDNIGLFPGARRINGIPSNTSYSMVLRNGPQALLTGSGEVLQFSGSKAKIQLLADNSAVNRIIDTSQNIRSMNLGNCPYTTLSDANDVNLGCYGETVNGKDCTVAFPILFESDFEGSFGEDVPLFNYNDETRLIPQPYLLYIFEKIIDNLGLTIIRNDINYNKYKHLLLIHGYKTFAYSKMLPDWTVSQFLSEIEKFFNVILDIHTSSMTLDIISVDTFYEGNEHVEYIGSGEVINLFDMSFEDASEFQSQYRHVGYRLPSGEYWQFQNITKEVLDLCTVVEGGSYIDNYDNKTFELHYIPTQDEFKIHYESSDPESPNPYFRYVQQFSDIREDEDVSKTELGIIPAKILVSHRVVSSGTVMFCGPIPTFYDVEDKSFSDRIRSGMEDGGSDTLSVAFYLGKCYTRTTAGNPNPSVSFAQAISTYWNQLFNVDFCFDPSNSGIPFTGYGRTWTLSLRGEYGRHKTELNNDLMLDTTSLYVITFKTNKFLDPRNVYIINGRKFYCKQLKYSVDKNGLRPTVEGEFFPAK